MDGLDGYSMYIKYSLQFETHKALAQAAAACKSVLHGSAYCVNPQPQDTARVLINKYFRACLLDSPCKYATDTGVKQYRYFDIGRASPSTMLPLPVSCWSAVIACQSPVALSARCLSLLLPSNLASLW